MFRVFNCGIGMVLVVSREDVKRAGEMLRAEGETVYEIGAIEKGAGEAQAIVV
jgi:phosphoribosylformylglycinamidine cyclo-ligase